MQSMTVADAAARPIPAGRVGERGRLPLGAWLLAIPLGVGAGVALGWWCRRDAGTATASGWLAEMGAPWIFVAFATGALTMLLTSRRRTRSTIGYQLGAAVAGATAGATALVVATIVYYGPARTGRFDIAGAGSSTLVWAAVSLAVGAVMGTIGALWWAAPTRTQAMACLVAAGVALTSEAYYLLDAGANAEPTARNVYVLVAIAGVALPLLIGLRWQAVAGVVLVAILAIPGSLVAEIVWRGALDGLVQVREYVANVPTG